ncbi:MAG: FGGY-family carbohydrate kinase [Lachnospiraceae bacterium]|nr:FGGY-family carbohydrate kinase [Lachnospiraceae bacterium]
MSQKDWIINGKTALGIELGSTRIKAVLVGEDGTPLASGSHTWENRYENGVWTYTLEDIWEGLRSSVASLMLDVKKVYDIQLNTIGSIGFSAMMHGYMAFDEKGELLVPFRTWRNTITEQAADILTERFAFNIPQRWSISHLYQAMLNKEEHLSQLNYMTTLAGYIHWQLTGEKVLGIGDASGMFPIDSATKDYDKEMVESFDKLVEENEYSWRLKDILPKVLVAGENAGRLTEEGAKLLDPCGTIKAGVPVCPPEGDAGTGMTATNSVAVRTGNVSAGTSVFAMIVLEKPLESVHKEIDIVTNPMGDDVAMVHCNNCTSDINAWANIFAEFSNAMGMSVDMNQIYTTMFESALKGSPDCGGLVGYNYFSGEPVTGFSEGRPLFVRTANSMFTFTNFMRLQLYSAVGALKYGLDILLNEEKVPIDKMYGHGGFFKTKIVGQKIMAAAMHAPVSVMETAGEGGAWGIAVLALYAANKKDEQSLPDYLNTVIFKQDAGVTVEPDEADTMGFDEYMKRYVDAFSVEQAAIDNLPEAERR